MTWFWVERLKVIGQVNSDTGWVQTLRLLSSCSEKLCELCACLCRQIPSFGPLFSGAIVDFASLPGLVRDTAVNAGNMIRTLKPFYQTLYPCYCHLHHHHHQEAAVAGIFQTQTQDLFV